MKFIYLIITITLISLSAKSQDTTLYYQNHKDPYTTSTEPVSKDNADYYITFGSKVGKLISYKKYSKAGTLQEDGTVKSIKTLAKQAEIISYYPSGKESTVQEFFDGHPKGPKIHYFENGKINYKIKITRLDNPSPWVRVTLIDYIYCESPEGEVILTDGNGYFKAYDDSLQLAEEGLVKDALATGEWKFYVKSILHHKEQYENGKLITGESYIDNKTYQYKVRELLPEYKGGMIRFYQYIGSSFKYPKSARENGVQGKVVLSFVVQADGSISDIKIAKGLSPEINEEAIRVLRNSRKWSPGLQFGKAVRVAYTLPISLNLDSSSKSNFPNKSF